MFAIQVWFLSPIEGLEIGYVSQHSLKKIREQPASPSSCGPCIKQTQAWVTLFQQLDMLQAGIVLGTVLKPW